MTGQREEKLKELIREKAAEFISSESNRTSLITVTRVDLSSDSKRAFIYISVMPTTSENAVIDFLKRQRRELRAHLQKEIKAGRIPFLEVLIDMGEKNRQRIDEISNSK